MRAHEALFYRDTDEFIAGTVAFVERGLDAGEPAMVAVPGPHVEVLREAMGDRARGVRFVDMTELGRNPGRIIPAVREWFDAQGGGPAHFVGEPIWPGRTAAESAEATRHEALLNYAFADEPVSILCPYDSRQLGADVVAAASQTHPVICCGGAATGSPTYSGDALATMNSFTEPDAPPASFAIGRDLVDLRHFVRAHASRAGLSAARLGDALLAVNEVATNTLEHGSGNGILRLWSEDSTFIAEIHDSGLVSDALAGRRRPADDGTGGRGLWMVHQLCDLVEFVRGDHGTTFRLHIATR